MAHAKSTDAALGSTRQFMALWKQAMRARQVPRQASYSVSDEQTMVLLGFLTFADPPKPDTAQVLQALKADGVQVKILTGDNEAVTRHVCAQVGLDAGRVVLGSELDQMTDEALAAVAEQVNVFARVAPAQKNRVILALKRRKQTLVVFVIRTAGNPLRSRPSVALTITVLLVVAIGIVLPYTPLGADSADRGAGVCC